MISYFWVAVGGAAGSVLRFGLQQLLNKNHFPWGTLGVNLGGCFLIGLLWGICERLQAGAPWRNLLMSGFCGGFTTHSAYSLETHQLLAGGNMLNALLYTTATVAGGLLATFIGYKLYHP